MDKQIKQKLDDVYEKYKSKYQSSFDKFIGLESKMKNMESFSPLTDKLADELISTSSSDDSKEYIQKLTLKFSQLMINPFD